MFADFFNEFKTQKAEAEKLLASANGKFMAEFIAWQYSDNSDATSARKCTENFTIVWVDETITETNTLESIKKDANYLTNEESFLRGKSNHIWVKYSFDYLTASPLSIERAIRTSNEHTIELKAGAKKQAEDTAASRARKLQNLSEEMRTATPERVLEIQAEIMSMFQK